MLDISIDRVLGTVVCYLFTGLFVWQGNKRKWPLFRLDRNVFVTPHQETIAGAVDVIVYLRRKGTGRVVEEILSIDGYDGEKGRYITHPLQ